MPVWEQENSELSYKEVEKETLGDLALLYNTYENNLLMVGFDGRERWLPKKIWCRVGEV